MKIDKIISGGFIAAGVLAFVSCDDFLSENTSSERVYIDERSDYPAKLLVSAYPEADYSFAEYMSDCAGDRGLNAYYNDAEVEQAYLWENILEQYQGTPTYYWVETYRAIATANHALKAIEEYEAQGRGDEVAEARGEALLCRAYGHFMLANIFCMPYDPATADTELGIPYATEPETTLNPTYKRETLAETYRLIEQDLLEGLKSVPVSMENAPAFHFTKKVANAFASRFYLWLGGEENIRKSKAYADEVLGSNPVNSLRQMNDPGSDYLGDYNNAQVIYTSSAEPANLLLVSATSYLYIQPFQRYGLTPYLRTAIYDNGIFGYDWAYRIYGGEEVVLHRPLWAYYFMQSGQNANYGTMIENVPLFTMEEVLFNRAEANAMLGNYDDALVDINTFLSKRLDLDSWNGTQITDGDIKLFFGYDKEKDLDWSERIDLFPYFKDFKDENNLKLYGYLKAILALRKAEFLGTGLRWFDIRRYDIPVVHNSVTHGTDTLVRGDRRRACQLPDMALGSGLEPNPVNKDLIPESLKEIASQPADDGLWDGVVIP